MEQISIERMEIAKEDTENEIKAVNKAIEMAKEILDVLPIDSEARDKTISYIADLESDEKWYEQILDEEKESIAFYSF